MSIRAVENFSFLLVNQEVFSLPKMRQSSSGSKLRVTVRNGDYSICSFVVGTPQPCLVLNASGTLKPKEGLGEDALFLCQHGKRMGVYDGVGAWGKNGVDAGVFARSLAQQTAECVLSTNSFDPVSILEFAHNRSKDIIGSSTACLGTLREDGTFSVLTVGDSVFFVIRQDKIFFRQREMQHGFNFPFQLGLGSPDQPRHGELVTLLLVEGDVIVMCTDGVTDNLFDEEILDAVNTGGTPPEIAERITEWAFARSRSTGAITPFSKAACAAGYSHLGGKKDDITVIAARVSKQ